MAVPAPVMTEPVQEAPVATTEGASRVARLVTIRAILVGLLGVIFVCVLTPFNDYLVNNTSLVGSALPMALILFILFIVLAVNLPLRKWLPRWALGQGELAVVLGMTLISCAIPGSAFMKYVPAHLVGIWNQASGNGLYRQLLDEIHLPDWMFPTTHGSDVSSRAADPVMQDYIGKATVPKDTFMAHWAAVPWHAWLVPALTWGALFAFIAGVAICMAAVVRRQWVENERLTFPLSTLCVSLIENPQPGRLVNETFRSPWFLAAFASVFFIHSLNALHEYFPQTWPTFPLNYDLRSIMTNAPWIYIDDKWVTKAKLSFLVTGVTYFVAGRIAFSVWFCMIALQVFRMFQGTFGEPHMGSDWPGEGFGDHAIGSMVPYTLMILWLGRREWAVVLRRMFRRAAPDDPIGPFLPYGVSGWGLVICTAGMFTWLMLAGASWIGSSMLVLTMLVFMLVLMRIVAETGIVAIQFLLPIYRPWSYLFKVMPSLAADPATLKPFFLTRLFNVFFSVTQRESLPVYASHAMQFAGTAAPQQAERSGQGVAFVLALALALVVGYVSAGGSMLFMEYKYSTSLDKAAKAVNEYGTIESAEYALEQSAPLMTSRAPQQETHSTILHLTAGAGITSILAILSVRFAGWPIHPLGYLLLFSWTTWAIWFSVMVGWLIKVIVLRLGGSQLYRAFRPVMIGLVIGECAAVGFWLCVSLLCVACGWEYHALNILPF